LEVKKGYAYLPVSYIQSTPKFKLDVDMHIRQISPHPFTNLDIVALARGPIVYCVEDVDNPWAKDHFKVIALLGSKTTLTNNTKTVVFDPKSEIVKKWTTDDSTGESYFSLTAKSAGNFLNPTNHSTLSPGSADDEDLSPADVDLHFVPFYYRANRGGTGQMRVGLRKLK
jgi:uncharacterized protein